MKPQNIYDNEKFFKGYKHLRDTQSGLNEVLEQPAIKNLLPRLDGLSILELGCGMGDFSKYCIEQGAKHVTALDISTNMLEIARSNNNHPRISFRNESIENMEISENSYDLIVSSLALHYVENYHEVLQKMNKALKQGGYLVFSIEHPITLANKKMTGWLKDEHGQRQHWAIDDYGEEGKRTQTWFVDGVVKYHRTLSTLINGLIASGFDLEQIEEPEAVSAALQARPELNQERRRPPFLLIKARKRQAGGV